MGKDLLLAATAPLGVGLLAARAQASFQHHIACFCSFFRDSPEGSAEHPPSCSQGPFELLQMRTAGRILLSRATEQCCQPKSCTGARGDCPAVDSHGSTGPTLPAAYKSLLPNRTDHQGITSIMRHGPNSLGDFVSKAPPGPRECRV